MTANQIAAASNRERERSDMVSEAENERHNKATEANDARALELTREHNQEMYSLQQDYNRAYLEYLNSSEENKDEREREKNRIQQKMADADAEYKNKMSVINSAQQRADEQYHNALIELQSENTDIAWKKAYYENQKTEADTQYIQNQINILNKRYELDKDRIEKEYSLGLIDANTRQQSLKLAQNKFDLDMIRFQSIETPQAAATLELTKAQTARQYSAIGSEWVDSILPDL